MHAREIQAENLAKFLIDTSLANGKLPIVIHGKAYKPDVAYCIGSYSTLIGHYIKAAGHKVSYLDPLADDPTDVVKTVDTPCVLLMAHNRFITYGYTGDVRDDTFYTPIQAGSIIVDPWRKLVETANHKVIHYGNTR
jgi:UDPglucose 6-dehydrogenase